MSLSIEEGLGKGRRPPPPRPGRSARHVSGRQKRGAPVADGPVPSFAQEKKTCLARSCGVRGNAFFLENWSGPRGQGDRDDPHRLRAPPIKCRCTPSIILIAGFLSYLRISFEAPSRCDCAGGAGGAAGAGRGRGSAYGSTISGDLNQIPVNTSGQQTTSESGNSRYGVARAALRRSAGRASLCRSLRRGAAADARFERPLDFDWPQPPNFTRTSHGGRVCFRTRLKCSQRATLWSTWLQPVNGPLRTVQYHALTECRPEVTMITVSIVSFVRSEGVPVPHSLSNTPQSPYISTSRLYEPLIFCIKIHPAVLESIGNIHTHINF
ncbi:hypothetical protein EVAR_78348_1 [Eumeta japonica]|uniref:Uncharacterized protein n=1 Tax=Eumeta variegata TaxID=151549 RepID=A0A4C1T3I7_EUMVA|nr:hypothetical protein EVAR_78348_1 [Eumeta japonica]